IPARRRIELEKRNRRIDPQERIDRRVGEWRRPLDSHAREAGWDVRDSDCDWARGDALLKRVVEVCAIRREEDVHGTLPRPSDVLTAPNSPSHPRRRRE